MNQQYNWPALIRKIKDTLFLNQQELAKRCEVSMACVSHWKNMIRKPGIYARRNLLEIAKQGEIDIGKYEIASTGHAIKKCLEKGNSKELCRIFKHYRKMSRRSQFKLLRYANTLTRQAWKT